MKLAEAVETSPARIRIWAAPIVLASLLLAGTGLLTYATVWGGGVSPDSAHYVVGARSLASGKGYSFPDGAGQPVPIMLWPPAFSALMAFAGLFGVDPSEAGRWLNLALFPANALLVACVVRRFTDGSSLPALVGAALFLIAPDLVEVHLWLWTEPLFLLFFIGAILLLAVYVQQPTHGRLLAAAALAAAASLTRYAGASLIAAGFIVTLYAPGKALRHRLGRGARFVAAASGPLALWFLRNAMAAGSATNRDLGFNRLYSVHFLPALETVAGWAYPSAAETLRWELGLAVLAASLGVFLLAEGSRLRAFLPGGSGVRHQAALPIASVFSLASYGAFLVVAKFFVDPFFPFDGRILAPAQAVGVILAGYSLHRLIQLARGSTLRRTVLMAGLFVLGALHLPPAWQETFRLVSQAHEKGLGYNSRSWRSSELVQFVADLPEYAVVFSNADEGLAYRTGHPAWRLPTSGAIQAGEGEETPGVRLLVERAGNSPAYVVYFDAITWRDLAGPSELAAYLNLRPVLRTGEGSVLQVAAAGDP